MDIIKHQIEEPGGAPRREAPPGSSKFGLTRLSYLFIGRGCLLQVCAFSEAPSRDIQTSQPEAGNFLVPRQFNSICLVL